ncbi:MAG TPA: hypothetical protein DCO72_09710 [Ruminococcus sp.]|nr:hypothetical protein [Ruminococcus sp.]
MLLADSVSTLLKPEIPVLQQRNETVRFITSLQGIEFSPETVKALTEISKFPNRSIFVRCENYQRRKLRTIKKKPVRKNQDWLL